MPYDPDKHHRRSIRLAGYDYASEGLYFITICALERQLIFGRVIDAHISLSETGRIVEEEWLHTPAIRPEIALDEFVVMPNHVHGIVVIITNTATKNPDHTAKLRSPARTLGAFVRGFKASVTKRVGHSIWQRNYHEHIIRDHNALQNIRRYIIDNPRRWTSNHRNPKE